MKLTNKIFANRIFTEAMSKFNQLHNLPMETFIEVIRINKKLEEHQTLYETARKAIIKKYGEDVGGNMVIPDDADASVHKNVNDDFQVLVETEFEIKDVKKIVLTKRFFGERGLVPIDVLALEDILDLDEFLKIKKEVKKKK